MYFRDKTLMPESKNFLSPVKGIRSLLLSKSAAHQFRKRALGSGFFAELPKELFEAAFVDGCSWRRSTSLPD
jgi:hypothetical protein